MSHKNRNIPTKIETGHRLNEFEVILLLVFVSLGLYLFSLRNAFVSDDIAGILNNPNVGTFKFAFQSVVGIFQNIFYSIITVIFGKAPWAFRLLNISFHTGSVVLLYKILDRFFRQKIAILAALLFAVHPLLTEPIVWISGFPYVLSAFFCLLAFYLFVRDKNVGDRIITFFCIVFSVVTSQKDFLFPGVLLIYELFIRDKNLKKRWLYVGLLQLVGIVKALSLVGFISVRVNSLQTEYYQPKVQINPFVQIPIAISNYLKLFVWPKALTLYHSELTTSRFGYWLMALIALLVIASAIFFTIKRSWIGLGLMLFLAQIAPTLTPFGVSWVVAERYVYFSIVGLIICITVLVESLPKYDKWLVSILIVLVFCFSGRAFMRSLDWKTADDLWLSAEKYSPSSPQNHNNLGDLYFRRGDVKRSIWEFSRAIEINPIYGDAMHNLASVYLSQGDYQNAAKYYEMSLQANPRIWQSYVNLSNIAVAAKDYSKAIEIVDKGLSFLPNHSYLLTQKGIVYFELNDKTKAKELFQAANKIDPTNQFAIKGLQVIESGQ